MGNPILALAAGEAPLWRVFWLYGVFPSNALWIVILALLYTAAPAVLLVALLLYTAWILLGVWQCADNVENALYGVIARWLTVAWAVNTVLLVLFIQLELLA